MRCLSIALLLPALLTLRPTRAQSTFPSRGPQPIQVPSRSLGQQFPSKITVAPTIPMGPEADGLLAVEPDSSRRRQYVRHRVRGVFKVRLNGQGAVQDTVEYQGFDEQGRRTQTGSSPDKPRQQWSYNAQGQCTARLDYPAPDHPYTLVNTYSPALHRGQQEVLQADGTRTVVRETQLYPSADTLLTEVMARSLTVGAYVYPAYYQRSLRVLPHPDTVLVLTGFYDQGRQLTGSRADYSVYRRGQLTESGRLDLAQAAKAQSVKLVAGQQVPLLSYPQALTALRHSQGKEAQRRLSYNAHHLLLRQETTTRLNQQGQVAQTVLRYTYNNLDQLIGREGSASSVRSAVKTAYTVFSYAPSGLLQGETTDARSSKPVFYRYLYQYYD